MRPDAPVRAATRPLLFAALAYSIFVVYGCLVPLHYTPVPWAAAWARFEHIPHLQPGPAFRSDWIANVLLFIPFAFLWRGALDAGHGPVVAAVKSAGVWLVAVVLVTGLEFAQVYFPPRSAALQDVFAASVGAAIGLAAWGLSARRVRHHLERWKAVRGRESLAGWLLWPYAAFLVLYNVMPLDLTSSPYVVFEKWKRGMIHVVPLASLGGNVADVAYAVVVESLLWLPLSALWAMSRRGGIGAAWSVAVLLAIVVESVQVLVQSRVSDSTDVMCAALGGFAGAWIGTRLRHRVPGVEPEVSRGDGARSALLALVGFFGWAAVLVAGFWYPFRFAYDPETVRARVARLEAIPFHSYWLGSEYHAFIELLRKLILFAPLGALLALGWARVRGPLARRTCAAGSVIAAACVAAAIEAGQVFLPGKTPDSTDAVIGTIGAALGYAAALAVRRRLAVAPERGAAETGRAGEGRSTAVHRRPHRSSRHEAAWRSPLPWMVAAAGYGVMVLGCAFLASSPAAPYNVRELFGKGPGILPVLLFPIVLFAAFFPPARAALWLARGGWGRAAAYPAVVLAHALLAWIGVWTVVPLEAIHDVVGSSVLDWPGYWELAGRFAALFGAVSTLLCGGALLAGALGGIDGCGRALHRWAAAAAPLLVLAHLVVVTGASTDNLTELMAGGGGVAASLWLGIWLVGSAAGGSALAMLAPGGVPRRATALLLAAAGIPFGWMALSLGTAPAIEKYRQVFSALQFLLSPDRTQYAVGGALLARYVAAHLAAIVVLAVTQAPVWTGTARRRGRG